MQTAQQILLVKQVEIRYFQNLIFPATSCKQETLLQQFFSTWFWYFFSI